MSYKSTRFDKFMDFYLDNVLLLDLIVAGITWFTLPFTYGLTPKLIQIENQLNITSTLISADISMTGFVIAALTIVATFKANVELKASDELKNAMELILKTKHYNRIVKVFKLAIVELIISAFTLFILWIIKDSLSTDYMVRINVAFMLVTLLAISRTILILFKTLNLSKYSK